MSPETRLRYAERAVERAKVKLQLAYDDLRAARFIVTGIAKRALEEPLHKANAALEAYCVGNYGCVAPDVHRLPIRFRFVLCARASGERLKWIAAQLPKIDGHGGYVRQGITVGGLGNVILKAERALRELRKGST